MFQLVAAIIHTLMLPVGHIIGQNDIVVHFHADDTQLYRSFSLMNLSSLSILHNCLLDFRPEVKTEV